MNSALQESVSTEVVRLEVIPVTGNVSVLESHVAAWNELAQNACDPNPFYHSANMMSAMVNLTPQTRVDVVFVYLDSDAWSLMIGMFPLTERTSGLPTTRKHRQLYNYAHCYLQTPLIHRDYVDVSIREFAEFCRHSHDIASVRSNLIPGTSQFFKGLQMLAHQHHLPFETSDYYSRAVLEPNVSFDEFLAKSISSKRRAHFRRSMRRLRELGNLEVDRFDAGRHSLEEWSEQFTDLEHRSWKGEAGTSLQMSDADQRFFADMLTSGIDEGTAEMYRLSLNDMPIAMNLQLAGHDGSLFGFKIAYDEKYKQYSPGVLLSMLFTQDLLDRRKEIGFVDSCVQATDTNWDKLWPDRMTIKRFRFGDGSWSTRLAFWGAKVVHNLRSGRGA